jgi:hypothetical protein
VKFMRSILMVAVAAAIFSAPALPADVQGTWKGILNTPNGAIETTFVFKMVEGKLNGSVVLGEQFGEAPITDGKVDGDNISFLVVRDFGNGELRLNYKGVVKGEEIRFTIDVPAMQQTFEVTAKRSA